jgi:hypothetical protein
VHRLGVLLYLLCLPVVVWGHGPAPSALTLFVDDTQSIKMIHTNIGLATPIGDGGYRYICPAQWGEEAYFPVPSILTDGSVAVVANGSVYVGDACELEQTVLEGWTGQAAGQSGDLVLERRADGSQIWSLKGEPSLRLSLPEVRVDSLLVQNGGAVFGASGQVVRLWDLPEAGPAVLLPLDSPPSGDYISIRMLDPVWFTLNGSEGIEVYQYINGGVERFDIADTSIHGPVRWGSGVAWISDGTLKLNEGHDTISLGQVPWGCLKRSGETVYACVDRELVRVEPSSDESGYAVSPLFELTDFEGVDPQCPQVESPLYTTCVRQWFHYGAEAGLIRDDTIPHESGGDGCAIGSAPSRPIFALLLLCVLARVRHWRQI